MPSRKITPYSPPGNTPAKRQTAANKTLGSLMQSKIITPPASAKRQKEKKR